MVMEFGQVHLASYKHMSGNEEIETNKYQSWIRALDAKLYFKILKNKIPQLPLKFWEFRQTFVYST